MLGTPAPALPAHLLCARALQCPSCTLRWQSSGVLPGVRARGPRQGSFYRQTVGFCASLFVFGRVSKRPPPGPCLPPPPPRPPHSAALPGANPPQVTKAPDGFVPNAQRKCRDTLCCLLFILFWIGMLVIAIVGFHYGSPRRLLYGTDYEGKTCGVGDNKATRYLAYPRNTEDYILNNGTLNPLDYKVCEVVGAVCAQLEQARGMPGGACGVPHVGVWWENGGGGRSASCTDLGVGAVWAPRRAGRVLA
jgi:hypothetical protein